MSSFLSDSSEDSRSPEEKLRLKNVSHFYSTLYKSDVVAADLKIIAEGSEMKVHDFVLMSEF